MVWRFCSNSNHYIHNVESKGQEEFCRSNNEAVGSVRRNQSKKETFLLDSNVIYKKLILQMDIDWSESIYIFPFADVVTIHNSVLGLISVHVFYYMHFHKNHMIQRILIIMRPGHLALVHESSHPTSPAWTPWLWHTTTWRNDITRCSTGWARPQFLIISTFWENRPIFFFFFEWTGEIKCPQRDWKGTSGCPALTWNWHLRELPSLSAPPMLRSATVWICALRHSKLIENDCFERRPRCCVPVNAERSRSWWTQDSCRH